MWTICEAGCEAAVVAAEIISNIVIVTSASDSLQRREFTVSSSMQSSLKAIARRRQQPNQITIRQSYERIEELGKRNNRAKMVWGPP
jgi:tRNA C32,U32 (ribose-2'-O)-methylase TrmJ